MLICLSYLVELYSTSCHCSVTRGLHLKVSTFASKSGDSYEYVILAVKNLVTGRFHLKYVRVRVKRFKRLRIKCITLVKM